MATQAQSILEKYGMAPLSELKSDKSLINNGVWNDTMINGTEMAFKVRSSEYKAFLSEVQPKFTKLNSKGDNNVDIDKAKAIMRDGYSNHILVDWVSYIKEEMYADLKVAYPELDLKSLGTKYLGSGDPLPEGIVAVNCIFFSEDGSPMKFTPANAKQALVVTDILNEIQKMSGDNTMYTHAQSLKSSS